MVRYITGRIALTFQEHVDFLRGARGKIAKVEGDTWELSEHVYVNLILILRRSRTGTVWFYTSTSNKGAARPKLYTKSLTRDLKLMYRRLTLVRISFNL